MTVYVTFDPRKNERNIRQRKLPFELAAEFDFDRAHILADVRHDYGERVLSRSVNPMDVYTSCVSRQRQMAFAGSAFAKPMIES